MKIIIFLPHLNYGGISRTASDLSCALPPSIKQHIVLLEDRVAYPYRGILHILGERCRKRLLVPGLRLLLNAIAFRRLLAKIEPDAVIAFHHDPREINYLAGLSLSHMQYRTVTVVLGVHSQAHQHPAKIRTRLHNLLVGEIYRKAHRIIACTQGVKADLLSSFKIEPGKIEVIPSAVDPGKIRRMASDPVDHPWFLEKIPIVISVGRFVREKNQRDLLKAFALIRKDRNCRLVLVGEGEMRDELRRLAADLKISNEVFFTGFQDNPFKFLARAEVFVLPSLHEAQGIAVVEALAVGCPVVAYDCPVGPREMLSPRNPAVSSSANIDYAEYGVLVPVGNVELLAQAILNLLNDGKLRHRYVKLGVDRALQFNMKDMISGYLKAITFDRASNYGEK